jgi:hypothetical protein
MTDETNACRAIPWCSRSSRTARCIWRTYCLCWGEHHPYTLCALCIEQYGLNDCIRELPCKHSFHQSCVDPWLIAKLTCPMCKTLITAEETVQTITTPSSPMTLDDHLYEEVEVQTDSITSETTLPTTSSSLESSPAFHSRHEPPRRMSNAAKNMTGPVWGPHQQFVIYCCTSPMRSYIHNFSVARSSHTPL